MNIYNYLQMRTSSSLLLVLLFSVSLFAQNPTISTNTTIFSCGHDALHFQLMEQDPDYRKATDQMEKRMYEATLALEQDIDNKSSEDVITLPIVFHIIHASDEEIGKGTNITDDQINDGLVFVNQAFRNIGPYAGNGVAANDPNNPERNKLKSVDTNIEFTLAKQDIHGRPVTGVFRYASDEFTRLNYGNVEDFAMKRWIAEQNNNGFPTEKYANIYLLDRICDSETGICGSIGGYAYLANSSGRFYDGVVAEAYRFGDSSGNTGIMVHELGHYLNLRHTFNDGCQNNDCLQDGDKVCDTPPDDSTNAVSCGNTANSCNTDARSGFDSDQNDITENYMDYGIQDCWNTFTQGQKNRMRLALENFRKELTISIGLVPVAGREVGIIDLLYPSEFLTCTTSANAVIQVRNDGTEDINSLTIQTEVGGVTSITEWTGLLRPSGTREIALNAVSLGATGTYDLNILITKVNDIFGDAFEGNNIVNFPFSYQAPIREVDHCEEIQLLGDSPFTLDQPTNRKTTIDIAEVNGCEENGNYAIRVNSFGQNLRTNLKGQIMLPTFDLNIYESPILIFDRSYRQSYSTSHTGLRLFASSDCGETYQEVYHKSGFALASKDGYRGGEIWIPESCDEWASDTIDLSGYKGENAVTLFFEVAAENVNDTDVYQWGNNLYIDNICVRESDAVASCRLAINAVDATNLTTCNSNNGTITIYANETEGVQYSINGENWQNSNTFAGLKAGSFLPQVRNAQILSCNANSEIIVITEPEPPLLENIITTTPSDCGNADGAIEIIAFGDSNRGSLEYSIDGTTWQSSNTFPSLTAGMYSPAVRYSGATACRTGASRVLDAPNAPSIADIQLTNPATCRGIIGALTIVPADETITYEYSIDGGATWQASANFSGLAAGEYNPRIRDAAKPSCVGETDAVTLVAQADANITASIEVSSDEICNGGWTRLIITASNGRSPYEVTYTDGTEEYIAVVTFSNATIVVRPTVTTTYSLVRAKDVSGCSTEVGGSVRVRVQECGDLIINDDSSLRTGISEFYPNPNALDKAYLDYVATTDEKLQVQVFDITGKLHTTTSRSVEAGYNRLELQLTQLPIGTYFVKLQTAEVQIVRKLVRQ